jgi:hypothetical protein
MNRITAAFPDLPCPPPTTVPHFARLRKNSTARLIGTTVMSPARAPVERRMAVRTLPG